jgi:hypothetical protein
MKWKKKQSEKNKKTIKRKKNNRYKNFCIIRYWDKKTHVMKFNNNLNLNKSMHNLK